MINIRKTFTLDNDTIKIIDGVCSQPGIDGNESAAVRLIIKEWERLQNLPTLLDGEPEEYDGRGPA